MASTLVIGADRDKVGREDARTRDDDVLGLFLFFGLRCAGGNLLQLQAQRQQARQQSGAGSAAQAAVGRMNDALVSAVADNRIRSFMVFPIYDATRQILLG